MEAVYIQDSFSPGASFKEASASFFKKRTPDGAKVLCWKLFQCWAQKDCNLKSDLTDEEVALFFDQLIALVAAAYIEHQANRVPNEPRGGEGHAS